MCKLPSVTSTVAKSPLVTSPRYRLPHGYNRPSDGGPAGAGRAAAGGRRAPAASATSAQHRADHVGRADADVLEQRRRPAIGPSTRASPPADCCQPSQLPACSPGPAGHRRRQRRRDQALAEHEQRQARHQRRPTRRRRASSGQTDGVATSPSRRVRDSPSRSLTRPDQPDLHDHQREADHREHGAGRPTAARPKRSSVSSANVASNPLKATMPDERHRDEPQDRRARRLAVDARRTRRRRLPTPAARRACPAAGRRACRPARARPRAARRRARRPSAGVGSRRSAARGRGDGSRAGGGWRRAPLTTTMAAAM